MSRALIIIMSVLPSRGLADSGENLAPARRAAATGGRGHCSLVRWLARDETRLSHRCMDSSAGRVWAPRRRLCGCFPCNFAALRDAILGKPEVCAPRVQTMCSGTELEAVRQDIHRVNFEGCIDGVCSRSPGLLAFLPTTTTTSTSSAVSYLFPALGWLLLCPHRWPWHSTLAVPCRAWGFAIKPYQDSASSAAQCSSEVSAPLPWRSGLL